MSFTQTVQPNTGQQAGAGWCHLLARSAFGAPVIAGLDSATKAANATKFRHGDWAMPNVAVPVWFDHWGTYSGIYGNWGHVVIWVPGRGFLSSPLYGFGQAWFASIEAVERAFNAKYRFWSEDINSLRVAKPIDSTKPPIIRKIRQKGRNMLFFWCKDVGRYYTVTPGVKKSFWSFATYPDNADRMATQLGEAMHVSAATFKTHQKLWG